MTNLDKVREALESLWRIAPIQSYEDEAEAARMDLDAHEEEVRELREAYDAACAFIDSHVADPDLTDEMVRNYSAFTEKRAALAKVKP